MPAPRGGGGGTQWWLAGADATHSLPWLTTTEPPPSNRLLGPYPTLAAAIAGARKFGYTKIIKPAPGSVPPPGGNPPGSGGGGVSAPVGVPYLNPFRSAQVTPERIDQGVDYSVSGPVYALGAGRVANVYNAGWPGGTFISVLLSEGPAAGHYYYLAENVTPSVQVGQAVTTSTVLGTAHGGIETGWAAPPGTGMSAARAAGQGFPQGPGGAYNNQPTAYGKAFSDLLSALGAPAGVASGSPTGSLPTWLTDLGAVLFPGAFVGGALASGGGGLLSGLTEIGHWIGVFVTGITDIHMWISLGWIVLGFLLILMGISFLLRLPQRLAKITGNVGQAASVAAAA